MLLLKRSAKQVPDRCQTGTYQLNTFDLITAVHTGPPELMATLQHASTAVSC